MPAKIREWLLRYGPAEAVSLPLTVVPAMLAMQTGGGRIGAALAGTWGGNIGYFGVILLCDVLATRRSLAIAGRAYTSRTFARNVRALIVEFGVAELLDSLIVRPALMYYLPVWTGHFMPGILAAKVLADCLFYLPAIVFYDGVSGAFAGFKFNFL